MIVFNLIRCNQTLCTKLSTQWQLDSEFAFHEINNNPVSVYEFVIISWNPSIQNKFNNLAKT